MSSSHGKISVLVTGAGSELAFGIIKACRLSGLRLRIVGCDSDGEALGLRWVDASHVAPRADTHPDEYRAFLEEVVRRERIDAILPTPDVELDLLPQLRDEFADRFGCRIAVNPQSEMDRFHDKWFAHQWYVSHDLPAPRTVLGTDADAVASLVQESGFPVIIKPRRGGGSRSIFTAVNQQELLARLEVVTDPIVQPLIGGDDEEYTAGTYRTRDDDVHVIVMQRVLKFGMTYKARVIFDDVMSKACARVILRTDLEGANNIQFRNTRGGIRILEINPRFSGTTGIRARFGFNEPEMFIMEHVVGRTPPPPRVRGGSVMRYMQESYSPALDGSSTSEALVEASV